MAYIALGASSVSPPAAIIPADTSHGSLFYDNTLNAWFWVISTGEVFELASTNAPSWIGPENPGTVVTSTSVGNIVDTRTIPAGSLVANNIVRVTVQALLTGTNNSKNLQICIAGDTSGALLATFAAAVTGTVTMHFYLFIGAAAPHVCNSTADLFTNANWFQTRGTVNLDFFTTQELLETRAWVANASDSITIDSINVELIQ